MRSTFEGVALDTKGPVAGRPCRARWPKIDAAVHYGVGQHDEQAT